MKIISWQFKFLPCRICIKGEIMVKKFSHLYIALYFLSSLKSQLDYFIKEFY